MTLNKILMRAAVAGAVLTGATAARADIVLTSGTSSMDVNTSTGIKSFVVDGVNNLYQEWVWYRIGNSGKAKTISSIGPATVLNHTPNSVELVYNNALIKADLTLDLVQAGNTSTLTKTITLTNNTSATKNFSLFVYSDYDLNGTTAGQTATFAPIATPFPGTGSITQSGPGKYSVIATANASDSPSTTIRHQESGFAALRNDITGVAHYQLSNNASFGPGDGTFAFEWDMLHVTGHHSRTESDSQVVFSSVPEPATVGLIGAGLLGLAVLRRRIARS